MNKSYNKITKDKFTEAIKGSYGIISNIARKLGCTRRTIYYFLDKEDNKDLKILIDEEKEILLDLAESNLFKSLKSKDKYERKWSTMFILNTFGAKRGYGNKNENANTNIDVNAIMKDLEISMPHSIKFIEMIAAGADCKKVYSDFKYYMAINNINVEGRDIIET